MATTESLDRVGFTHVTERSQPGVRKSGVRRWVLPLVGAALYPELIELFSQAIQSYRTSGYRLHAVYATLLIVLAGSIPLLAGRALVLVGRVDGRGRALPRSLLFLMFSVAPLHILSGQVAWLTRAKGPVMVAIWLCAWSLAAAALYFEKGDVHPARRTAGITWLRVTHGTVAAFLLCGFLLSHLINHDLALWSVTLHGRVMEVLRHWYRAQWVEPVLLVLLAIMVSTGAPLVAMHARQRADGFRLLQMATGVYLGLFLCAHLFAVLGARQGGVETDWHFAVGTPGLLDGRAALIVYYIYSSLFLILHAGFGLRGVLLKHGTRPAVANQAVYGIGAIGLLVTMLLAIAAFGIHIRGS